MENLPFIMSASSIFGIFMYLLLWMPQKALKRYENYYQYTIDQHDYYASVDEALKEEFERVVFWFEKFRNTLDTKELLKHKKRIRETYNPNYFVI